MDNSSSQPDYFWVITEKGRVVRSDKVPEDEPAPSHLPDPCTEGEEMANCFYQRDDAYSFRDELTDAFPTFFLDKTAPQIFNPDAEASDDSTAGKKQQRRNYSQEEFQRITRKRAFEYYDVFWRAFTKLRPKDQCEIYLKMVQFGFAKAPNLRPVDEEQLQREKDSKKAEVAEAIRQGITPADDNFEEEDE
jgi:hypothetical protein